MKEKVLDYMKNKKIALTIKGVQWSTLESYMRDKVRDMFLDILLTSDIQKCIDETKYQAYQEYNNSMQRLIYGD